MDSSDVRGFRVVAGQYQALCGKVKSPWIGVDHSTSVTLSV